MKPVYIDVGAHTGQQVSWALDNGYEVYAFEPNPKMWESLSQYQTRATIYMVAAWDSDGMADLYSAGGDGTGESLIKGKSNVDQQNPTSVRTVDIGTWLKNLDRDIAILKIDAEGAEYRIIESILEKFDPKRIKDWLVEDHSNRISSPEWLRHRDRVLTKVKEANIILKPW